VEQGFGQSPLRLEDTRLLRGEGRYTADLNAAGQAHMYVLRTPHAHADIVSIGVSAANAAPGVIAVLTGADAAADELGVMAVAVRPDNRDGSPPFSPPQPVLGADRVRYGGQPVALVIAETLAQARDAAELIEIDYQPLAAAGTLAAALAPEAVQLWDEAPGNVALDWQAGSLADTLAAFDAAAHVTSLDLVDNRVMVMPMEPVAALAAYDEATGRYHLQAPSQGVHGLRRELAETALKIEQSDLQVVTPDVGGAFGLRATAIPEQALLLWAARKTGRPVKWVAERGEACLSDLAARDHITKAWLALDGDGRILAVRVENLANMGAYGSPGALTIPTAGYAAAITGCYDIPAFHVATKAIFSNSMMTNAYRGAGRPEGIYVIERLIDVAAAELGLSKIDIRRRNMVPAAAMPYATATGELYDSGDFGGCLDRVMAMLGEADIDQRRSAARRRGKRYGVGVAAYVKINGGVPSEAAHLTIDGQGAAILRIGCQDNGQGHRTAFAQILVEELGLALGSVALVQGDSDAVASGHGTGGSSAISVAGVAVTLAARKVVEAGRQVAAMLLQCDAAEVEFADGLYCAGERTVSLSETAKDAGGLEGSAKYVAAAKTFANGCHVCEVEVDVDTGHVAIVGYRVADDMGRLLNPRLAEGQVHGGIGQGIGQALLEDCIIDGASGQLLSGSLMDYCLPRADDLPSFAVQFDEIPCATNLLGVKGVGEAGVTGALPAVVNAVVDALTEYGVMHIDMPLKPERVWRAISKGLAA
jgi:carbon-monoxide dehydrogenase large subunit